MSNVKWISLDEEQPPVGTKVKLSYGLFGIRGAVCDDWVSEGWLTNSGKWSIKQTGRIKFSSKPDHFAYID